MSDHADLKYLGLSGDLTPKFGNENVVVWPWLTTQVGDDHQTICFHFPNGDSLNSRVLSNINWRTLQNIAKSKDVVSARYLGYGKTDSTQVVEIYLRHPNGKKGSVKRAKWMAQMISEVYKKHLELSKQSVPEEDIEYYQRESLPGGEYWLAT